MYEYSSIWSPSEYIWEKIHLAIFLRLGTSCLMQSPRCAWEGAQVGIGRGRVRVLVRLLCPWVFMSGMRRCKQMYAREQRFLGNGFVGRKS